ncbi:nucleoside-triphosphatase [Candidatus Xianfuyuplasma coldseepsis]|uniref:Thymidine kinase n=1 Tax=Candidatus Xianfuyuplasma coldseepsis TaxID=2782163 RepID=A0A7L7KP11_9MOLU|nr:nucleoside-triphosphatase [Xianfuyuplasma coldseepsis]QMS84407.1 hypothetical protein G4Z02_01165 [Xianfuyuplasma coldseepsis]
MIHIVTGTINSGKSSRLLHLYHQHQQGDGFISVKRMHYQTVHGYDLLRLRDLSTRPFVMHEKFYHDTDREIACQIGPYLFFKDVLQDIEQEIINSIKQGASPIFLDEIGLLELQHKCFAKLLQFIVKHDIEAYITVRKDLIDDVVSTFSITSYDIV